MEAGGAHLPASKGPSVSFREGHLEFSALQIPCLPEDSALSQ